MRVVITGATGFLGSRVARALIAAGHEVAGVVRESSNLHRLSDILPHLLLMEAGAAVSSLDSFGPEALVHTSTCYGRKGEPASHLVETNVRFPLMLLESASAAGARVFVNTDTTLPGQLNAYALSKAHFAQWSRRVAAETMSCANVRLEYMYGPCDDESKFPTQVLRACIRNQPHLRLTAGEQTRDFIYVDDVVDAFVILLQAGITASPGWNDYGLGTGIETTLRKFAETAKRETRASTELLFGAIPYREAEQMRSFADTASLRRLGWSSRTSLVEGIRKVIASERSSCAS